MPDYTVLGGDTNFSATIRIIDATDGTPELGVTAATGGLVLEYRREGAVNVSLATITDLALLTTAHTDKGILHIGNGYYRVDIPDAAVAAGAAGVLVHGIATGMVVIASYVHIVAYNPQDVVRLGLTALPNAAAEAAGGLYTRGIGVGQINQDASGRIDANIAAYGGTAGTFAAGRPEVNTTLIEGTDATDQINAACDVAVADQIVVYHLDHLFFATYDPAAKPGAADALLNELVESDAGVARFTSNALDVVWSDNTPPAGANLDAAITSRLAAADINLTAGVLDEVTLCITTTNNSDMRGTDNVPAASVTGTSTGGSTTTVVDTARTEADDVWNGSLIRMTSGPAIGQTRLIVDFATTGDIITVAPAFTAAVVTSNTYEILPFGRADVAQWLGSVPNALIGGAVDADVSVLQAGVIVAATFATDSVDANALAPDAAQEIRNSVTGGVYPLDTDGSGRIRIVDGTGAGELDTTAGVVLANVTQYGGSAGTFAAGRPEVNTTLIEGGDASDAINAEVLDVLNVDTFAQPVKGAPTATASIVTQIGFLYKAWRNHSTQTASLYELYNDDAVTVDHEATVSDDATTFTRQEMVIGT